MNVPCVFQFDSLVQTATGFNHEEGKAYYEYLSSHAEAGNGTPSLAPRAFPMRRRHWITRQDIFWHSEFMSHLPKRSPYVLIYPLFAVGRHPICRRADLGKSKFPWLQLGNGSDPLADYHLRKHLGKSVTLFRQRRTMRSDSCRLLGRRWTDKAP